MTDDSIDSMMHQGKSLAQWAEDFKGEFSIDQLEKMARGGADLQKILMLGLDEAEQLTPYEGLPGEQMLVFEEERSIKDYMMPNCQIRIFDDDGNEIFWSWIDVKYLDVIVPYIGTGVCGSNNLTDNSVQAGAFIPDNGWQKYEGQTLTTFIYVDGEPLSLDHQELAQQIKDVKARADRVYKNAIVPAKIRRYNQEHALNEISHEDEMAAFNEDAVNESIIPKFTVRVKARGITMNFTSTADTKAQAEDEIRNQLKKLLKDTNAKIDVEEVTSLKKDSVNESTGEDPGIETAADLVDAVNEATEGYNNSTVLKIVDENGKEFNIDFLGMHRGALVIEIGDKELSEGYNWKNGGYGGYGRSYRSYGEVGAPRGKSISWFKVSDLDPKASKLDADGWRAGPSNFPFVDLLYPERKYKVGTTVMRKNVKAGAESGNKYIAIPSYIDAIKNNDEAAIGLLKALGIPLDLTFGYEPGEDFSSTYTVAAEA